jgi:hypothetical protein
MEKIFNLLCAQTLMDIRLWPSQRSQKLKLPRGNIFILEIFTRICSLEGNNFPLAGGFPSPDMRLSPTFYLLLGESMQFYFDLSYPLSIQQAMAFRTRMKTNHHLYVVVLFRDGSIMLVAILSSNDFLPPTHIHEFHFMIDYMFIYAHDYYVLHLSLLYHIIKHRGIYLDEMINWLHWLYDFT